MKLIFSVRPGVGREGLLFYESIKNFLLKSKREWYGDFKPFKRQTHKMVKYTQTFHWQQPTNCYCLLTILRGWCFKVSLILIVILLTENNCKWFKKAAFIEYYHGFLLGIVSKLHSEYYANLNELTSISPESSEKLFSQNQNIKIQRISHILTAISTKSLR